MSDRLRVIGIDPGSRLCGWGVVERQGSRLVHIDNGVLAVADDGAPLAERLARLMRAIDAVILRHNPTVSAIETVFANRNVRAALILGHARGVAMASLAMAGLDVSEYTPQQVKKAVTGSGRADKTQVQEMVTRRLELGETPQEDAADAVAVALCHAQHASLGPLPSVVIPKQPRGGRKRADAALKAMALEQARKRSTR